MQLYSQWEKIQNLEKKLNKYENIRFEKSRKSSSFYITIQLNEMEDLKISVRDHDNCYSKGDYHYDVRKYENFTQLKKYIMEIVKIHGKKDVKLTIKCEHKNYNKSINYCFDCRKKGDFK